MWSVSWRPHILNQQFVPSWCISQLLLVIHLLYSWSICGSYPLATLITIPYKCSEVTPLLRTSDQVKAPYCCFVWPIAIPWYGAPLIVFPILLTIQNDVYIYLCFSTAALLPSLVGYCCLWSFMFPLQNMSYIFIGRSDILSQLWPPIVHDAPRLKSHHLH